MNERMFYKKNLRKKIEKIETKKKENEEEELKKKMKERKVGSKR